MSIRKFAQWSFTNLGNFLTLCGWFVSAGFFPALLKLSTGATLLQYGIAAVAGLIAFAVFRVCWNGARILKANAIARERLSSESSSFDPMAREFVDKRLFLRDLVPPGRRRLDGRKFLRCEIIGPGNIVVMLRSDETQPWPIFQHNIFNDVDMVQIAKAKLSNTAIYFPDCDFEHCHFFNVNLMFFERQNENWWWITPDPAQPTLLPDGAATAAVAFDSLEAENEQNE